MRRKTTRKRSIRPQGGLANPLKIGYTSPCGAEFFRCVGGCFTCAGHRELALPVTAVVLFSIAIISYCCSGIKRFAPKKFPCDFVKIIQVSTHFAAFSIASVNFKRFFSPIRTRKYAKNMPASSHEDAGIPVYVSLEICCYIFTNFMLFSHLDFLVFPTYPPIPHHRTAFPDGKAGLSECGQWRWS